MTACEYYEKLAALGYERDATLDAGADPETVNTNYQAALVAAGVAE